MATILNNPNCSSSLGNTGLPTCSVDFAQIVGAIFVDPTFNITSAQLATTAALKTALQNATLAAPGAGRIYPLPRFEEVTDNSTDPKEETLGFGASVVIMESKNQHTWRFLKGGMGVNSKLRTFNYKNYSVLYLTDKEIIGVADGSGGMYGFSTSQIYTYPVKLNDGSKGNQYRIKIVESNVGEWDTYAVALCNDGTATGWNPQSSLLGLLDVTLDDFSSTVTDIILTAVTTLDQSDIVSVYATELADPTAWVVKSLAGVTQTVTAAVVDEPNKQVILSGTFDAGGVTVTMAAPAALAALSIGGPPSSGFEANTITINPYAS